MQDLQLCPLCKQTGIISHLQSYQINLDEAIVLCVNKECTYPLNNGGRDVTFSRTLKEMSSDWCSAVPHKVPDAQLALETKAASNMKRFNFKNQVEAKGLQTGNPQLKQKSFAPLSLFGKQSGALYHSKKQSSTLKQIEFAHDKDDDQECKPNFLQLMCQIYGDITDAPKCTSANSNFLNTFNRGVLDKVYSLDSSIDSLSSMSSCSSNSSVDSGYSKKHGRKHSPFKFSKSNLSESTFVKQSEITFGMQSESAVAVTQSADMLGAQSLATTGTQSISHCGKQSTDTLVTQASISGAQCASISETQSTCISEMHISIDSETQSASIPGTQPANIPVAQSTCILGMDICNDSQTQSASNFSIAHSTTMTESLTGISFPQVASMSVSHLTNGSGIQSTNMSGILSSLVENNTDKLAILKPTSTNFSSVNCLFVPLEHELTDINIHRTVCAKSESTNILGDVTFSPGKVKATIEDVVESCKVDNTFLSSTHKEIQNEPLCSGGIQRNDIKTHIECQELLRYPNVFPQWKNVDSLCWLNVILCLAVHNETLKAVVLNESFDKTSLIYKLFTAHKKACAILNKVSGEPKVVPDVSYQIVKMVSAFNNTETKKNQYVHMKIVSANHSPSSMLNKNGVSKTDMPEAVVELERGSNKFNYDAAERRGAASSEVVVVDRILNSVRNEIWEHLKCKLKCECGDEESPVFAFPLLLKEQKIVAKLFSMQYRFEYECSRCHFKELTDHTNILPTLPAVVTTFNIRIPQHKKICPACHYTRDKRTMVYQKLPECMLMHFTDGLTSVAWKHLQFGFHGNVYTITGVIQYMNNPDHFVAWLRNPTDDRWMKCNDLGQTICNYMAGSPKFPAKQRHIIMWERIGSKLPIASEISVKMPHELLPKCSVLGISAGSVCVTSRKNSTKDGETDEKVGDKLSRQSELVHTLKNAHSKALATSVKYNQPNHRADLQTKSWQCSKSVNVNKWHNLKIVNEVKVNKKKVVDKNRTESVHLSKSGKSKLLNVLTKGKWSSSSSLSKDAFRILDSKNSQKPSDPITPACPADSPAPKENLTDLSSVKQYLLNKATGKTVSRLRFEGLNLKSIPSCSKESADLHGIEFSSNIASVPSLTVSSSSNKTPKGLDLLGMNQQVVSDFKSKRKSSDSNSSFPSKRIKNNQVSNSTSEKMKLVRQCAERNMDRNDFSVGNDNNIDIDFERLLQLPPKDRCETENVLQDLYDTLNISYITVTDAMPDITTDIDDILNMTGFGDMVPD